MSQAATTSVHHVVHVQLGAPRATPGLDRLLICYGGCPHLVDGACRRSGLIFRERVLHLAYLPAAKCADGRW